MCYRREGNAEGRATSARPARAVRAGGKTERCVTMNEFAAYATKEITPTQEAFADWILAEVFGGNLPKGLNVDSFRRSVALGGSLRSQFQKSDWWKNDSRNYLANVEANRAAKTAEKAEKAKEQAAKAVARAAKLEKDAADAVAAAKAKAAALAAKADAA